MLHFPDRQLFATGLAGFSYRAIAGTGESPRILLQVGIEGILTEAIVDTGAPYLIRNPQLVQQLDLKSVPSLKTINLNVRGYRVRGELLRRL